MLPGKEVILILRGKWRKKVIEKKGRRREITEIRIQCPRHSRLRIRPDRGCWGSSFT